MKNSNSLVTVVALGCSLLPIFALGGCRLSSTSATTPPAVEPGPRPFANRPQLVPQVGHSGALKAVAFSPDGRLCATANGDYETPTEIKLWDAKTWQVLRTFVGPRDEITMLAFSPDGATLAAASEDSWENEPYPVRLWSVASGKTLSRLAAGNRIKGIVFSRDGATLFTASGNEYAWWNARSGTLIKKQQASFFESFASSPDGSLIATGNYGSVHIQDATSGTLQKTVQGQSTQINDLAWSPDGSTIVSAGEGGIIRLVDVNSGSILKAIKAGTDQVNSLAFAPDGLSFAAACGSAGVRIWDTQGTLLRTIPVQRYAGQLVAWSPDGKSLIGDNDIGAFSVWDARNGKVQRRLVGNAALGRFTASKDGRWWATSAEGTVHLWDARAGRVRRVVTQHPPDECCDAGVAFTQDGRTLATGAGEVRLWDTDTGRLKRTIRGFGKRTETISFLRGTERLFTTGSSEGYWKNTDNYYSGVYSYLWDARSGRAPQRTFKLERPNDKWGASQFAPDGRLFAIMNNAGQAQIQLFDTQSGRLRDTLRPARQPVKNQSDGSSDSSSDFTLSYSEQGMIAASIGKGRIVLWQPSMRRPSQPQRELQLKIGKKPWHDVANLDFGPHGQTLVTTGSDTVLRFWDMKTGQQVRSVSSPDVGVFGWHSFSPDGRLVLTQGSNGTFEMRNAKNGKLLVTLMVFPPTRPSLPVSEWLAYTPAGFYASSPGARRFIRWLSGNQLYPASKFEKQFHRPDLVQKALQGKAAA
ncbi:MAG TPA: WD40 repeat domain-containing protein [Abditibacteriaceae bacterium]|jgi:WD40 repeat protein